jgi:hypothetical protein
METQCFRQHLRAYTRGLKLLQSPFQRYQNVVRSRNLRREKKEIIISTDKYFMNI